MKKTILFVVFALFVSFTSFAQSAMKVGYINVDYVLTQLPDTKLVEQQLKEHEKQLQNQLQAKGTDFEAKVAEFRRTGESMLPAIRADKEKELQNLQRSIQEFQSNAQQSLQKKQVELLDPVYTKIQTSIDAVSKEHGFTYIFSSHVAGAPILLFAKEEYDVANLVLKNLGVTPAPKQDKK